MWAETVLYSYSCFNNELPPTQFCFFCSGEQGNSLVPNDTFMCQSARHWNPPNRDATNWSYKQWVLNSCRHAWRCDRCDVIQLYNISHLGVANIFVACLALECGARTLNRSRSSSTLSVLMGQKLQVGRRGERASGEAQQSAAVGSSNSLLRFWVSSPVIPAFYCVRVPARSAWMLHACTAPLSLLTRPGEYLEM